MTIYQRDWVKRLPYVMAAYRVSRHEATGFSLNHLVFGREVRAPIDLILGAANDLPASSREDFVERQERLYREAYSMVCAHLGEQGQWQKQSYNMRVQPTTFPVMTWAWLYSPRQYLGRSPKWLRNYSGPILVEQRMVRSKPQVVHIDKFSHFLGKPRRVGSSMGLSPHLPKRKHR